MKKREEKKQKVQYSIEFRYLSRFSKGFVYFTLILCALCVLYPLFWLLSASFKSPMELAVNVWGLPKKIIIQNYLDAWKIGRMGYYIFNSVKVALVSITATLICSSMLAFILARLRFKGRSTIYYGILLGLMIPIHAIIIPLYITTRDLGLHNNLYCIGLVYAAFQIPFSVFVLRGFMAGIPESLEEAAILDGCGIFRVFIYIILPLTKEGLITIAILTLMSAWNELLVAMLLISNVSMKTLPLGLVGFITEYSSKYSELCAGLIIACLPNIIFYAVCQEKMIKGMTMGAVKE